MRRLVIAFTAGLLIVLGISTPVGAHVLEADGSIGAVLHIKPDDAPKVGESTEYEVAFRDETGKFTMSACDCKAVVLKNDQIVATTMLASSEPELSKNHFTFTEAGVYTMRFVGKPKMNDTFQPFTLNYEIRVTNGHTKLQSIPIALWIGMAMAVILILLSSFAIDYNDSTKQKGEV